MTREEAARWFIANDGKTGMDLSRVIYWYDITENGKRCVKVFTDNGSEEPFVSYREDDADAVMLALTAAPAAEELANAHGIAQACERRAEAAERASFEKWANGAGLDVRPTPNPSPRFAEYYITREADTAFAAWQARAALAGEK